MAVAAGAGSASRLRLFLPAAGAAAAGAALRLLLDLSAAFFPPALADFFWLTFFESATSAVFPAFAFDFSAWLSFGSMCSA